MSTFVKWFIGVAISVIVLSAIGGLIFYAGWVDFVDNYQLGYKYDRRDGEIEVLPRTGYFVNPPWLVTVHTIDGRPMQVCINANSRVLNCKLVQFNPAGIKLFLSWHGRNNYEGTGLGEILKSYAYDGSGRSYPFLTILKELKPENVGLPQ